MLCSIRSLLSIAVVLPCLLNLGSSAPAPLHTPSDIELPFNIVQGGDPRSLLHDLAGSIDHGSRPEGWERLMRAPETNGSSGIVIISPSDLEPVIRTWGIDESMYNQTFEGINTLIHTAIGEGIYAARGFAYQLPKCIDKERPVCLSTLIVAARVQLTDDEEEVWRAELGHIYMKSAAESLQQPYKLTVQELVDIESVLNYQQSNWALDHVPVPEDLSSPQSAPMSTMSAEEHGSETKSLEHLMGQIIDNAAENTDVFAKHDESLLDAIQEATEAREQSMNNMQLTLDEHEVPELLQNTFSDCFAEAGVQEQVSEWWARVYPDLRGKPISIECESARQRKEAISPPMANCSASANVTTMTSYSWAMIAPKDDLLTVMLLDNNLDVNFLDCDLFNDPSDSSASVPDSDSTGAVIRWAVVQPDGSFRPVQYLNHWSLYPENIDKVMLDILRYDTATGYLNVAGPQTSLADSILNSQRQIDSVLNPPQRQAAALALSENTKALVLSPRALPPILASLTMDMITKAITAFAETWEKVAKALSSGVTNTVQKRICLGFDSVSYQADAFVLTGIARRDVSNAMKELSEIAELPKRKDIRSVMMGMTYSQNFTWTGENMIYRDQEGKQSFLFLAKHGDAKTGQANIVYSKVTSNFNLAKDMLIVRRQVSVLGGIWKSDKTEIDYTPHTLTPNDTQMLQMFWQMIAFRQMALSAGLPEPPRPDLSWLCDRSIKG